LLLPVFVAETRRRDAPLAAQPFRLELSAEMSKPISFAVSLRAQCRRDTFASGPKSLSQFEPTDEMVPLRVVSSMAVVGPVA
jgi:hypothetical protein